MKALLVFATLISLNTQASDALLGDPTQTFESEAARRLRENPPTIRKLKPNEIVARRLTYDGIIVGALKADNRLQLINPFASVEYGWAEDNLVRDPITQRPSGLKIFSIKF
jgi:hypothetical protein